MAHTKVTKTHSQNTGAANTFSYSGSFDVFKATEVEVELDNVKLTYTTSTINESASPREYTVDASAKTVHIGGADLSSGTIVIQPVTDMGAPTPRADYTPGASITSADLNNNQLQLMRKAMEYDEQKLSSRGGTMTGNLHFGKDIDLSFEGSTDNAYETTLTVTDPTADRTITLPNVSGTIVTTGDTATITATMMAADSVDSSELVDGSVDLSHMSANSVDSSKIVNSTIVNDDISSSAAIEFTKLENLDSAKILVGNGSNNATEVAVSGDVTIANTGAVTIATGAVEHAMLAGDCIDGDNIQDDVINSEHYAAGSVDHEHLANDIIDGDNIQDDVINSEHYAAGSIDHEHLATDIIDGDNIQDDVINSEHIAAGAIDLEHMSSASVDSDNIVDDTIVNADINSAAAIAHTKLAAVSSGQVIVGNGSNVPTSVAMSGDVAIAAGGATTIQANSVEIGMIGCEQTTITDSDSHLPTSGAVVDYVAAAIAPIGGLEVIADDESFPNTIPPAGVVISITDCAGLSVNSSGVSTNGDALDNTTITINGFPSELRGGVGGNADPYVFASGAGLMVQSTGSSHTYNYHQALIREADFVQLSDDISDFNSRYRIGTKTADNHSSNDDGDLFFDTGANKMYVYDGAYNSGGAWKEVTSAGDFKFLTIKDHDQAVGGSGPTFNGSNEEFDLFDSSADASINSAAQLIVVLNGVVQKPNSGTFSGSEEGFYLNDTHGIKFCDPPPSGSVLFVTQIGTAVALNEPADDTVSEAKIQTGAVSHVKLAADCVDGDNLADNAVNSEHYTDGSIDHVHLAADIVDGDNLADDAVGSEHIEVLDAALQFGDSVKAQFGTGNDAEIYFDSANLIIRETTGAGDIYVESDDIYLRKHDGSETMAHFKSDADVALFYNNSKKLETQNLGVTISGHVDLNDDNKIRLGTASDLEMYHDGNNSLIKNTTGDLNLYGDEVNILNAAADEFKAKFITDGACELYFNNSKKLATYSEGTRTTGYIKVSDDTSDSYWGEDSHNWSKFHTSGAETCVVFENSHDSTPYGNYFYFSDAAPDNNSQYFLVGDDNASTRFRIYSDGDFYSHDNSYTGSDQTLKENIVDATSKLEDLKKLKVRNFNWKSEYFPEKSKKKQLGFIAQEVEQVFPALVTEHDIAPGTPGDDHTPVIKKAIKQAWDPIIIKAMQELIEKVETLETKVAALEAG